MKILITADLHLNIPKRDPQTGLTNLQALQYEIEKEQPDYVIIAGDFCTASHAERFLPQLPFQVPIIACLGNHDYWVDDKDQFENMEEVREKFWRRHHSPNFHILDFESVELEGLSIAGGYGHFDLEMRDASLVVNGQQATFRDYQRGQFLNAGWNDFHAIPNPNDPREVQLQADRIESQLTEAKNPVLVVTHTIPFAELNGHNEPPHTLRRFYQAFSGNTKVGEILKRHASRIQLAVCGHTHKPVGPLKLHGIECVNIGTDYGLYRSFFWKT